jgi:hypothetical protein
MVVVSQRSKVEGRGTIVDGGKSMQPAVESQWSKAEVNGDIHKVRGGEFGYLG